MSDGSSLCVFTSLLQCFQHVAFCMIARILVHSTPDQLHTLRMHIIEELVLATLHTSLKRFFDQNHYWKSVSPNKSSD